MLFAHQILSLKFCMHFWIMHCSQYIAPVSLFQISCPNIFFIEACRLYIIFVHQFDIHSILKMCSNTYICRMHCWIHKYPFSLQFTFLHMWVTESENVYWSSHEAKRHKKYCGHRYQQIYSRYWSCRHVMLCGLLSEAGHAQSESSYLIQL